MIYTNSPFRFPDGSLKPIAGADDIEGATAVADPPKTGEDEEEVEDTEDTEDVEDVEDDGDDEEDADSADEADGDQAGGSGSAEDSEEDDSEDDDSTEVTKPSGADILALLAGDEEAQQLLQATYQQMQQEHAATEAARAEQEEFKQLVEKEDYAEIGRRIVDRSRDSATREEVSTQALQQEFQPVYQTLFAQPELKELSQEQKAELAPNKFANDASYTLALQAAILNKRWEKQLESEVDKRIKQRDEASKNRRTADEVKRGNIASGTAASGTTPVRQDSKSLISMGLKEALGISDEDEE